MAFKISCFVGDNKNIYVPDINGEKFYIHKADELTADEKVTFDFLVNNKGMMPVPMPKALVEFRSVQEKQTKVKATKTKRQPRNVDVRNAEQIREALNDEQWEQFDAIWHADAPVTMTVNGKEEEFKNCFPGAKRWLKVAGIAQNY